MSRYFATSQNIPHAAALQPKLPVLPWLCVFTIAILLVGMDSGRLSAPFGPSHDGFNAALYMTGGRAILEEGLLASRFGASSRTPWGDHVVYAHHPPFVYLADAVVLAFVSSTETAARLPAVFSSFIVLVLVALLMSAIGVSSVSASLGLIAAFATPMFLMFGAMTEPHTLGLAPMTALTLLWQRARLGAEPSAALLAAVAALAVSTSWQAGTFAASVGVALLIDRRRKVGIAMLAGTATSATLIGAWLLWANYGDLTDFVQRAVHRVGSGELGRVTFAQMTLRQMQYFSDLFPVGSWLVIPLAVLGVFDRRTRPLVAVSLGTVLGYALLFKNGAYDHDYWLYCILLPLSLSAATAADALFRLLSRCAWLRLTPPVLATALAVLLGISIGQPSIEQRQRRHAAMLGAQLRDLSWPSEQRYAYHAFGGRGPTDLMPWVYYYTRRPPFGVDGPQSVPLGQVLLSLVGGRLVTVPGAKPNTP